MKNIFSTTLILTGLLLSGCGSTTVDMPMDDMMNDDHHMGESDVMPHGHDDEPMADSPRPPSRVEADVPHDDTNTDPHGH
ncbi:hypothetical protein COU75_04235 [Candidatus Peregrinibacteria bacterium CG10_big_fil_rev_8_21_14_0_10_42_8]|nr:MAG: hypothetical protein COU75_04235 [Candidatus Peregrinibacteria bacterium CG10_big_fil_rev_8_21_14_0_10_42_8]